VVVGVLYKDDISLTVLPQMPMSSIVFNCYNFHNGDRYDKSERRTTTATRAAVPSASTVTATSFTTPTTSKVNALVVGVVKRVLVTVLGAVTFTVVSVFVCGFLRNTITRKTSSVKHQLTCTYRLLKIRTDGSHYQVYRSFSIFTITLSTAVRL